MSRSDPGKDITSESRRSPRSSVQENVEIIWEGEGGVWRRTQARTENVSAQGALLRTGQPLPYLRPLGLGRAGCVTVGRVVRVGQPKLEGWLPVAIELVYPNRRFWAQLR